MHYPYQQVKDVGPVRFRPQRGMRLTLDCIRGPWRPSGTVAGAGVFAVIWSTSRSAFWAALHDFEPEAQSRLIAQCHAIDQDAN